MTLACKCQNKSLIISYFFVFFSYFCYTIKVEVIEVKDIIKMVKGIGTFFLFLFVNLYTPIYQQYIVKYYSFTPTWVLLTLGIIMELLLLSIIVLINYKDIMRQIKDISKNYDSYFKKYFKYWIIAFIVMAFSNFIIALLTNSTVSANEEAIRQIFNISPIYIFISAVIIAPLTEELVFRLGFRNTFQSKWLYILASGVTFGALHVVLSYTNMIELLYVIPYSALGIAFAYMMYETKNVFVSVGYHFLHNGLLIALQFFILIFAH